MYSQEYYSNIALTLLILSQRKIRKLSENNTNRFQISHVGMTVPSGVRRGRVTGPGDKLEVDSLM